MEVNDFGFSFIDDTREELEKVTQENKTTEDELKTRLQLMVDAIEPLLKNLASNPEKSTIHWPNRVDVIDTFRLKLENIRDGK